MAAAEATFVAFVLVMMLSLLFVGWKTPEVVVSGRVPRSKPPKPCDNIYGSENHYYNAEITVGHTLHLHLIPYNAATY